MTSAVNNKRKNNMKKSKAQQQQEMVAAKAANEAAVETVVIETPLEQIDGEVSGKVVNLEAPKAKAPKAAKAEPTAEELAAAAAAAAEKEAQIAETKKAIEAAEKVVADTQAEADLANAALASAKLEVKRLKGTLSTNGSGVVSPRIEGKGVIETIIDLFKAGHSRPEIIKMGYNKSTVQRQVGEYLKKQKEPVVVETVETAEAGI